MILVAEDNDINQLVIEHTLRAAGYEFVIVENGKLAVEHFISLQPDIILMDISMPEMNGQQATMAIRELEQETGGHVMIVALTAHALNGDREKYLEAGMDDYMPKPIGPRALIQKLEEWLSSDAEKQGLSA